MKSTYCPNLASCKLVIAENVVPDEVLRNSYINVYCKSNNERWQGCKRLIVKNKLNFCPDFVLPDTTLTIDEIIDKFDNENID